MKTKPLFLLWALAAALGLAIFAMQKMSQTQNSTSTLFATGDLLLPDLDPAKLTAVTIETPSKSADSPKQITHLIRQNKLWRVKERENYPVNIAQLSEIIDTLANAKITQALQAGPTYNARFGICSTDFSQATPVTQSVENSLTLTLHEGKKRRIIHLGKTSTTSKLGGDRNSTSSSGVSNSGGRFIRLGVDPAAIYTVNDTFPNLTSHPADWLQQDFLSLSPLKKIHLTAPKNKSFTPWTLSRRNQSGEHSDLLLAGLSRKKSTNLVETNNLKNFLAQPRFTEVFNKAEALKKQADPATQRHATLTTFDGFTYQLNIREMKSDQAGEGDTEINPALGPDQGEKSYLLSYQVSLDLPPLPETAKADLAQKAALQKEQAALKEKFVQQQTLEGRIYQLNSWDLSALLKTKAELIAPVQGAPASRR